MAAAHELRAEVMASLEALMALRRRAICEEPLPRDISLPQLNVLAVLSDSGPMTLSEVAHLFRISAPSASSIVDRIEEHGWACRVRDTGDRRVVHVCISERGQSLVDEIMGLKRQGVTRLLNAMTEPELRDVMRGMKAVHRALDRATATAERPGHLDRETVA